MRSSPDREGLVEEIDNRRIAKVAKLAGAPEREVRGSSAARSVRMNGLIRGQPLYTIHADSEGELEYALDYVGASPGIIRLSL